MLSAGLLHTWEFVVAPIVQYISFGFVIVCPPTFSKAELEIDGKYWR